MNDQILKQAESKDKEIKVARKDAVDTSRNVLRGKINEEIAPFLKEYPYKPSDSKFLGCPFDFFVLDGMSNGEINEIIFVDIKTGGAKLSSIQRKIKQAVEDKRVSWKTITISQ